MRVATSAGVDGTGRREEPQAVADLDVVVVLDLAVGVPWHDFEQVALWWNRCRWYLPELGASHLGLRHFVMLAVDLNVEHRVRLVLFRVRLVVVGHAGLLLIPRYHGCVVLDNHAAP